MKHFIQMLSLAVLLAISLASCSSTRKVASEQTQQSVTTTISTDTQTQTQTNDAVGVRTHETDFSNAVIEFTKVEYADGTEEVNTTDADAQHEAVKQRDREETEPPNSTRKVKSVTTGRVTLQNDKTKQTETNVEHNEVSQIDESVNSDVAAEVETSVKSEDKPKHGFFFYFGIIATVIIVLFAGYCIAYAVWRIRKQLKNRQPK